MRPDHRPRPLDPELRTQRDFLRRLARGILGDHALAEDVVQEAEMRSLPLGAAPTEGTRAWLVTVTRRLALNALRARERRARHERVVARSDALSDHDEALEGLELQGAVLQAVRALDEPYRTAVWQRYYEDRTPLEIAVRTGLPVATVKTRLRRALELLRAGLDQKHGGRRSAWAGGLLVLTGRGPRAAVGPVGGLLGGLLLGGLMTAKKLGFALALVVLAWLGWRARDGMHGTTTTPTTALETYELLALRPPAAPESEHVAHGRSAAVATPPVSPSAAVPGMASLEVHVVWEDGTDASGIGLTLWPMDDCRAHLHARLAVTGPRGRARMLEIPGGSYRLLSDRDTETPIELGQVAERTLEVVLPAGLDVVGLVLDGAHSPVAGAEVWLEGSGSLGGRVVTHSGVDGTFRLRGLGQYQALGAFAPGYMPAFLELLRTRKPVLGEDVVRVSLVLPRSGRELRGRVLDAEGMPVRGARVALGANGNSVGRDGWRPRARILETDALGSFEAGWIEDELDGQSRYPLHVLAEGHALASLPDGEVRAALGGELVVRLERGVRIEGHAADERGQRLADVAVTVRTAAGFDLGVVPFLAPATRSRADGSYVLEHVPSGTVQLEAWLESDLSRGTKSERVLFDGACERWDLTLGAGHGVKGRVVDDRGEGLAGRNVLVSDERGMTSLESDAAGAFVFAPTWPGEEWTFALVGPSGVLDQRDGVRRGAEVVLVERLHEGRIRGGFTDRAVLAGEDEWVLASLSAADGVHMSSHAELDALGAFAFEGVAPGRYRVTIQSGARTIAQGDWFDLAEGHTIELAWLESRPQGE